MITKALSFATATISFLTVASSQPLTDTTLHTGRIQEIRFRSGRFEIAANLYLPAVERNRYPAVVWVAGSGPGYRSISSPETKKVVNCFLDNGVAYLRIDKPGYGDSKGSVNDDSLFAELSGIVLDAVDTLRHTAYIDPEKIGLFGSSQAGYIMPLAISRSPAISFMIGSSCPGENSIEQWDYLLERQMLCEGVPAERARESIRMFSILRCTTIKKEFNDALEYFKNNPMIVPSVGYDSSFVQKAKDWWPRTIDTTDESHYNPIRLVEKFRIPLYLVYGAHDTQIDAVQAMDAYRSACARSGNDRLRMISLPASDHNMCLSEGCLDEVAEKNRTGTYHIDPEYLAVLQKWIQELFNASVRLRN